MTEQEKRRQRQIQAYDNVSPYDKGVMDCAAWLAIEADLESYAAKRLAQQMRNKFIEARNQ